MTKIRCKKCNDVLEGDKKGTFIQCSCKACYIDETLYYCRVGGNPEDIEEVDPLVEKELEIISHYKPRHQVKHLFGEVSELEEAIIDYEYVEAYKGSPAERFQREHLIEEVGDIQLMVNQFKRFYDISDEDIRGVMEIKADRQLKRIEEEGQ